MTDLLKPGYTSLSLSQISVLKMEKCIDVDADADTDVDADGRVLRTKPMRIRSSNHRLF